MQRAIVILILCRQTGCNSLWVRDEENCLMADKLCTGFQKKGVMGSNSERQPAGEEVDPQVWIPFPFKAALTVHFYLISPGRKRKFPVGSGCEGKTIWSWFALGYAPLPSNPRWWSEWKQLGINHLTKVPIKHRRGKSPNHCWFGLGTQAQTDLRGNFRTKAGLYTGQAWKVAQLFAPGIQNSLSVLHLSIILPISIQFLKKRWRNVD